MYEANSLRGRSPFPSCARNCEFFPSTLFYHLEVPLPGNSRCYLGLFTIYQPCSFQWNSLLHSLIIDAIVFTMQLPAVITSISNPPQNIWVSIFIFPASGSLKFLPTHLAVVPRMFSPPVHQASGLSPALHVRNAGLSQWSHAGDHILYH